MFGKLLWRTWPSANNSRCLSGTARDPDRERPIISLGFCSKSWKDWQRALIIVRPETVVSWHRTGFRLFWTRISASKHRRVISRECRRPVIIAGFLRTANLVLQSQNYRLGTGNLEWSHASRKSQILHIPLITFSLRMLWRDGLGVRANSRPAGRCLMHLSPRSAQPTRRAKASLFCHAVHVEPRLMKQPCANATLRRLQ
jgi:hypothetical protein